MATDYVVRLQGQDNLTGTINKVKESLKEVGGSTDKLDLITQKFQKIESSTAPLKKKIRDLKNLMAQMNLDGLSNTDIFSRMAEQAGIYADAIADASAATSAFANDNFKLEAMAQGLQGLAAAGSIATGVMGLLGSENKEVAQAILKVQSALAILNGVQSIANVLNKDSALMLRLKQIRTLANTSATTGNTVATTANTAAITLNSSMTKKDTIVQTAWNMAKAIAKALLGDYTGLILVGVGALATYAIATASSTDKIEEQTKATKKANEVQDNYNKSLAANAANLVSKFKLLQNQWVQLRTEADKTQWIKENATEFSNLGFAINDVKAAEDVFVRNTDNVVKALEARAAAMAAEEGLTNAYKRYYDRQQQIDNTVEGGGYYHNVKAGSSYEQGSEVVKELTAVMKKNGDVASDGSAYNKDNKYYTMNKGKFVLTPYAAQEINKKREAEAVQRRNKNQQENQAELNKDIGFFTNEIKKNTQTFTSVLGNPKHPTTPTTPTTSKPSPTTPKPEKPKTQLELDREALEEVNKGLNQAISDFNKGLISKETLEETVKAANDYYKENNIKAFVELEINPNDQGFEEAAIKKIEKVKQEEKPKEPVAKEGSLEDIQKKLSEAEAAIKLEVYGSEEYYRLAKLIAELTDKEHIIQLQIDNDGIKSQFEKLEDYKNQMEEISGVVGTIGNSFSSLGTSVGGAGGKVLEFIGNTAQGISQLIPQIVSLIAANEAQAIAGGTASAASMPFPANIAAIAAIVATITGIFASLAGSFADGGIVGGASLHGDRLLARVNSGEMILNSRQQANLFKALDGTGIAANFGGNVKFEIDGRVIKGVLNNVNSKLNKQS